MKKEYIIQARNHAYDMMLNAQGMMDYAENESEKNIADYLYRMSWAAYWTLVELEKMGKRK